MNTEFEQKKSTASSQKKGLRHSGKAGSAPVDHRKVTLNTAQQKTRRKMARDIILVLLVVTGAILALSIIQGWNLRQDISRALVKDATAAIREKFNDLATPIQRDLVVYRKWGESNLLDLADPSGLSQKFIPLLELQPVVTGLILADTGGSEYFLYKDGDTWVSRSAENYQTEMEVTLNRWDTQGKQIETWQEKRRFDPRTRGWFTGALQSIQAGNLFWTEPYSFITARKVGITASVGWRGKSGDSRLYVAAVDILLDDIFNFVAGLQITPNAQVLLVRNDGSVMTIPESHSGTAAGTGTGASFVAPEDMKEAASRDALMHWKKNGSLELEVIEFFSGGDTWWAGFKPMQDAASSGWIAVVIPEKDLIGDFVLKRRNIVIFVTVILVAGVLLIGYLVRRYSVQFKTEGIAGAEKNIESEMTRLIAVGENSRVEFKSTLRVNLNTGKRDKAIELSWLKSVAAFMNSEGGDAFM